MAPSLPQAGDRVKQGEINQICAGCGVATKVERELKEGEAADEGIFAEMVDFTRHDREEECRREESSELELFTTDDVDGKQDKVVAWQEFKCGDNNLPRAC
ncbi:15248_t:CDS:2 [Acaulospora colombiana]|uniref:15248_t:CDS:1 n=1 Tax=Acaulospora colombiana TaxID=27376 RepID=A0ACA9PVK7_9GLOM|nr:15248_t:CDS:2 [Acaulospora colombiana]